MNMKQLLNAAKENYEAAVNMASMFLTGEIEPQNPAEVLIMFDTGCYWLEKAAKSDSAAKFPDLEFLTYQQKQLVQLILKREKRFLGYAETAVRTGYEWVIRALAALAAVLENESQASAEWQLYRRQ